MKQITKFNYVWNRALAIILVIFGVIYFISPVDLIPDVAIGVGHIDDFVVNLSAICNTYIQFRKRMS